MKIHKIGYQRQDDRGMLIEVDRGDWKQLNILKINKDESFGGHYHKLRREMFYVIDGIGSLNGNKYLTSGTKIEIEPGDMHTIHAFTEMWIAELLSEPYNEEDTWKKTLL